jgi:hypothetical protein
VAASRSHEREIFKAVFLCRFGERDVENSRKMRSGNWYFQRGQGEFGSLAFNLMKTSTKVFTVISLLLFVVAGLLCHRALRDERRAKPVLEQAISFEEGFSFTNIFTVPETSYYFVDLVFPRDHSPASHEHDVKYLNAFGAAMETIQIN